MLSKYDLENTILKILNENPTKWYSKKKMYKIMGKLYNDKHELNLGHYFYVWYNLTTNSLHKIVITNIDGESFIKLKSYLNFVNNMFEVEIENIYKYEEFPYIEINEVIKHMILYPSLYKNNGKEFLLMMTGNKKPIEEIIKDSPYIKDFTNQYLKGNNNFVLNMDIELREGERQRERDIYEDNKKLIIISCLGLVASIIGIITVYPFSS
jgi:hypothetical protein